MYRVVLVYARIRDRLYSELPKLKCSDLVFTVRRISVRIPEVIGAISKMDRRPSSSQKINVFTVYTVWDMSRYNVLC